MTRTKTTGLALLTLSIGAAGGISLGHRLAMRGPHDDVARVAPAADVGPRFRVPVGHSPSRGADDGARVTIIEFSDYQCPYCKNVEGALEQVAREYKGKGVRLVWKDSPLPFHSNALLAAEAAQAAGEQGKFWPMHDLVFKHQDALDRASLEKYAEEIGLDMTKFRDALDTHRFKQSIDGEIAEANRFGVNGTPSFFINGRPFTGALPFAVFKRAIDEELATAKGSYEETVRDGIAKAEPPQQKPAPGELDPNTVYKAEVGRSPVRGDRNARVTIVMWSDFQCPFCARVEDTLDAVRKAYGNNVRVVWKNMPLPFHDYALPAAEAAMAAGEQGKFWEMHDLLFHNQRALDRPSLDRYAQQLGLDAKKFAAALDTHKFRGDIDADVKQASTIGVNGTPTLFINGKPLVGAQPFDAFKGRIDAELATAKPAYDDLMKTAKAQAPDPHRPAVDRTVYRVDAGDSYARGPRNARVTIVEFSDFQCPFCKGVEKTLDDLIKSYGTKVRVVWKNVPLPIHQYARPAALAALAAGEQGKFWEMHDALFAHQEALDKDALERYAQLIGLDLPKFRAAMSDERLKRSLDRDLALAQSLSADGLMTPMFFINGRKLVGAQPTEAFKQVIDEELARKVAMR